MLGVLLGAWPWHAASAADLSVGSVTIGPGTTTDVVVSGDIAGETTFGVTILIEITGRTGNTGTVTFTLSPPVDITQAGDPWPSAGTFTAFDTDSSGFSDTLNGTVDDDGNFVGAAVTYSGPLSSFPIVASSDAEGNWDVVLSTSVGDSSWENLATTLTAGTVTVTAAECFGDGDCDDGVACTDDTCVSGSCVFAANDANCDDTLFCNGTETCDAAQDCQSGTPPCDDGVACTDDSCDDGTDSCTNTANDANCTDDGQFCTGDEVCDAQQGCVSTGDPCSGQICDETNDACVPCQFDSDCGDGLFCNGAETCDSGACVAGTDPCSGQICDEDNNTCLSDEAILSVQDLVVDPGTSGEIVVTGDIAGAATFGVTILVELVPRTGNIGTLAFTPAPPSDINQLGDPWPGTGTFSAFDTDASGFSASVNGSVDDNGSFSAEAVTFTGPLTGFPVVASADAGGIWDVLLTTSVGDSTWEGVTTTLNAGTVSVPPSVGLSVQSRAMPPGSSTDLVLEGTINGEATFGVTILAEIIPRAGNTGTLTFTPSPPVDIRQLGDPWPAGGTFSRFDTDAAGFSTTLNGSVDDNGTFSAGSVTFTGPLSAFPVVADATADGVWDIVLSTSAGDSTWEGLTTGLSHGTITVTAGACLVDADCDDANVCTDDVCDLGVCRHTNNTAACDDGDQCTSGDACSLGVCSGTPVPEGSSCDDADLCTLNDVCIGGVCDGTPVGCSSLDGQCAVGTCDPADGTCFASPINEGNACDDGSLCTTGDVCSAGSCTGAPVDCSSLDDQCVLGSCDPADGTCQAVPITDGTACDDGDLCTENDACSAGTCAGTAIDCSSLDSGCEVGTCDPATGVCEAVAVNEGDACNDGDPCTVSDTCLGGACSGSPKDCSSLDSFCSVGTCNASTGACGRTAVNEGAACDDGFTCTTGDQCTSGFCTGTLVDPPSVDLELVPVLATVQSGDLFGVDLIAYSGTCADQATASIEVIVTWDPTLVRLAGKSDGTPKKWPSSTFPNDSSLDGLNAPFSRTPGNDGDALYQAFAGFTLSKAIFVPEAGDRVTTLLFEALDGTLDTPISILSTFGTYSRTRVLRAGTSAGSDITGTLASTSVRIIECTGAADCADGNVCTDDVCTSGICSNPDNTIACDDGLFCTANDVCGSGTCTGSGDPCTAPLLCSEGLNACVECLSNADCVDGNVCTTDTCDAQGSCVFANNTATCNDGLFCTATDRCSGGSCGGSGDRCPGQRCDEPNDRCVECLGDADCNDNNVCTDEVCVDGACQYTDNTNSCNDGLFCTTTDVCSGGTCTGSGDPCTAPLLCSESLNACVECLSNADCNDGNLCTTDQCISGTCSNTDNTVNCNDGLFCTATDTCSSGACVGSGDPCPGEMCDESGNRCVECFVDADCDDGIACTVDACDTATGDCVFTPDDSLCTDGVFCNGAETCDVTILGCRAGANPCDNPDLCDEAADQCGCSPPAVSPAGPRYLRIRPAAGQQRLALRITGDAGDSQVACLTGYVQANGRVGTTPVFRTPGEWGVVDVGDSEIIPGTTYHVQSDCRDGASEPENLSTVASATTFLWGDVNDSGIVDVLDVTAAVDAFRGIFTNATRENADLAPCVPDRNIDVIDITRDVDAFRGIPYPCATPCP